jgi:hypothetical protein
MYETKLETENIISTEKGPYDNDDSIMLTN